MTDRCRMGSAGSSSAGPSGEVVDELLLLLGHPHEPPLGAGGEQRLPPPGLGRFEPVGMPFQFDEDDAGDRVDERQIWVAGVTLDRGLPAVPLVQRRPDGEDPVAEDAGGFDDRFLTVGFAGAGLTPSFGGGPDDPGGVTISTAEVIVSNPDTGGRHSAGVGCRRRRRQRDRRVGGEQGVHASDGVGVDGVTVDELCDLIGRDEDSSADRDAAELASADELTDGLLVKSELLGDLGNREETDGFGRHEDQCAPLRPARFFLLSLYISRSLWITRGGYPQRVGDIGARRIPAF